MQLNQNKLHEINDGSEIKCSEHQNNVNEHEVKRSDIECSRKIHGTGVNEWMKSNDTNMKWHEVAMEL